MKHRAYISLAVVVLLVSVTHAIKLVSSDNKILELDGAFNSNQGIHLDYPYETVKFAVTCLKNTNTTDLCFSETTELRMVVNVTKVFEVLNNSLLIDEGFHVIRGRITAQPAQDLSALFSISNIWKEELIGNHYWNLAQLSHLSCASHSFLIQSVRYLILPVSSISNSANLFQCMNRLKHLKVVDIDPESTVEEFEKFTVAHANILAKSTSLSSLTSLDLSQLEFTGDSLLKLSSSIHLRKIKTLNLSEIKVIPEILSQSLAHIMNHYENLKHLLLRNVLLDKDSIETLSNSSVIQSLQRLDLSHCHIHSTGLKKLAKSIASSTIDFLILSGNNLNDTDAFELASSGSMSLKHLDLSRNSLQARGASFIFLSKKIPDFLDLDLSHNDINGTELLAALGNSTIGKFEELTLDGNNLGPSFIEYLAKSSELQNLHKLYLNSCNIGNAGVQMLSNDSTLTQLRVLFLGDNKLGPEALKTLANVSHHLFQNLEGLYLQNNELTVKDVEILASSSVLQKKLRRLNILSLESKQRSWPLSLLYGSTSADYNFTATLNSFPYLEQLYIDLTDESLQFLKSVTLNHLTVLEVGGDEFSNVGFSNLIQSNICRKLNSLQVWIGSNSYREIRWTLMPKLKHLSIFSVVVQPVDFFYDFSYLPRSLSHLKIWSKIEYDEFQNRLLISLPRLKLFWLAIKTNDLVSIKTTKDLFKHVSSPEFLFEFGFDHTLLLSDVFEANTIDNHEISHALIPTPSNDANESVESEESEKSLILGVAIGSSFLLLIVMGVITFFYCRRRRRLEKEATLRAFAGGRLHIFHYGAVKNISKSFRR